MNNIIFVNYINLRIVIKKMIHYLHLQFYKMSKAKITKDIFVERAIGIHGNKYNYSNIDYINMDTYVYIECNYHKVTCRILPNKHIYAKQGGCMLCKKQSISEYHSIPLEDIIRRAKEKHGNLYDYSNTKKVNTRKITIICRTHGEFIQRFNDHINKGCGCRKCAQEATCKLKRSSTEQFIEKANIIHNNKYDYTKTVYIDSKLKVIIICKVHGKFKQTPNNHLHGFMCKLCGHSITTIINASTSIEFIQKANIIHNNIYDYSNVVYINNKTNVDIICSKHGLFTQAPNNHLHGQICKKCSMNGYSKIACQWLTEIAEEKGIFIQHALNIGEKRIGKYSVDGFCENSNTIFEFLGCIFHGCNQCYSRDKLNTLVHKTMGELYDKTMARELILLQQGYFMVTIWECEYRKILKNRKLNNK